MFIALGKDGIIGINVLNHINSGKIVNMYLYT
jgi:hypothetical protein